MGKQATKETPERATEKESGMVQTSILAVFSVLLATAGQLLLRNGMQSVGVIDARRLQRPILLATQVFRSPSVLLGLGIFIISAVAWLIVLSRVPLSFAYPFVGLTYVFVTLASRLFLHEPVPSLRWLGLLLILMGIAVVGRTSRAGLG
jgi:drug/metabolite transporter (DMT)-like permease